LLNGRIQISNETRLRRFINDLNISYRNNNDIPEYNEIKERCIQILRDNIASEPIVFGGLIWEAYLDIWGYKIQNNIWVATRPTHYNMINYIEAHENSPGAIQITDGVNTIRVASYYNPDPDFPKGKTERNIQEDREETSFEAAKRELEEETGINESVFGALREEPPTDPRARVKIFRYNINHATYMELVNHMQRVAEIQVGEHRTADTTSIHYKKYMKYKAKYLALVKSMGNK